MSVSARWTALCLGALLVSVAVLAPRRAEENSDPHADATESPDAGAAAGNSERDDVQRVPGGRLVVVDGAGDALTEPTGTLHVRSKDGLLAGRLEVRRGRFELGEWGPGGTLAEPFTAAWFEGRAYRALPVDPAAAQGGRVRPPQGSGEMLRLELLLAPELTLRVLSALDSAPLRDVELHAAGDPDGPALARGDSPLRVSAIELARGEALDLRQIALRVSAPGFGEGMLELSLVATQQRTVLLEPLP